MHIFNIFSHGKISFTSQNFIIMVLAFKGPSLCRGPNNFMLIPRLGTFGGKHSFTIIKTKFKRGTILNNLRRNSKNGGGILYNSLVGSIGDAIRASF